MPRVFRFFVHGCGDHRVLHSFPTRRSSDLSYIVQPPAATAEPAPPEGNSLRQVFTLLRNMSGDRKSTRLNSSHITISYAVFCLKKKKPIAEEIWLRIDEEASAHL